MYVSHSLYRIHRLFSIYFIYCEKKNAKKITHLFYLFFAAYSHYTLFACFFPLGVCFATSNTHSFAVQLYDDAIIPMYFICSCNNTLYRYVIIMYKISIFVWHRVWCTLNCLVKIDNDLSKCVLASFLFNVCRSIAGCCYCRCYYSRTMIILFSDAIVTSLFNCWQTLKFN